MQSAKSILQLRQVLAERHPGSCVTADSLSPKSKGRWLTGLPRLDQALGGGLVRGGISELIAAKRSTGGASLIVSLLQRAAETNQWLALVDGSDCFEPAALDNEVASHLLWVRCRKADEALKAADLLLRDGNLPLVILDLALNPASQLRKVPLSAWHRFRRLLEHTAAILLVFSPMKLVASADARCILKNQFSWETLEQDPDEIVHALWPESDGNTADELSRPAFA